MTLLSYERLVPRWTVHKWKLVFRNVYCNFLLTWTSLRSSQINAAFCMSNNYIMPSQLISISAVYPFPTMPLCVQMLLRFLKLITLRPLTRMDLNSVSMIMAPNLFLVQSGRRNKALEGIEISMAAGTSSIVRMIIKNQRIYWTVSGCCKGLCKVKK